MPGVRQTLRASPVMSMTPAEQFWGSGRSILYQVRVPQSLP